LNNVTYKSGKTIKKLKIYKLKENELDNIEGGGQLLSEEK
jgi:hypothetical protein